MIQSGNSCRIEKQFVAMLLVGRSDLMHFVHLAHCGEWQLELPVALSTHNGNSAFLRRDVPARPEFEPSGKAVRQFGGRR